MANVWSSGLTFNETQARQDSRKGEQSRRLVEAIAVCRSILAQEPLASREGASDAGLVLAIWLAFPCAGKAPLEGHIHCGPRSSRLVCADRWLDRVHFRHDRVYYLQQLTRLPLLYCQSLPIVPRRTRRYASAGKARQALPVELLP